MSKDNDGSGWAHIGAPGRDALGLIEDELRELGWLGGLHVSGLKCPALRGELFKVSAFGLSDGLVVPELRGGLMVPWLRGGLGVCAVNNVLSEARNEQRPPVALRGDVSGRANNDKDPLSPDTLRGGSGAGGGTLLESSSKTANSRNGSASSSSGQVGCTHADATAGAAGMGTGVAVGTAGASVGVKCGAAGALYVGTSACKGVQHGALYDGLRPVTLGLGLGGGWGGRGPRGQSVGGSNRVTVNPTCTCAPVLVRPKTLRGAHTTGLRGEVAVAWARR